MARTLQTSPETATREPRQHEGPARHSRHSSSHSRHYLTRFSLAGLTGALLFYCLSLTPSLLPRAWYLQAVMSGITVAIGYAVGTFAGWLLGSLIPWRPGRALRLAGRWSLAGATVVLIPLFGFLGAKWQHQIRELADVSQPSEARYILVILVSILIAAAIIAVARGIRSLVRAVAGPLRRVIPPRTVTALAVLIVCLILGFLATGVLPRAAVGAANSVFGDIDNGTAAGIAQPLTALRSGSPESLVPWSTLGREGKTFVGTGPTEAEISKFTGTAMEPIRVYVGLKSAPSIAAESALAVRELERTGAFRRKVIVVATPTGTGWLNPAMIDPLEYMYSGNTAVVAVQYSYLPNWISFLTDKAAAQEASRDLFDAVYHKWLQLPAGQRPKLVVFGEGVGSFGGQAAFSGTEDIRNRASGALWVGTPAQLDPASSEWGQPRAVYLQNPSDPIVRWSWQLAFHQPDWLRGTRPPDVSPAMHWYPLVTFWQVTADLALAAAVPPGHGQTYGMLQGAAAWASIIPPPGWTAQRTAELGALPAN